MTEPEYSTKSAFVAIVGRPNVGKSSLLNALIGEKVAIVSDKPQTTRTRITGVLTRGETQFVFIDTPGLHKPRTRLSEYMVKQVSDSVADVDVALLVVEPQGEIAPAERDLIASFRAQRIPAVLVVNKIDTLANKEKLMPRILAFTKEYEFSAVVPISALTRDGVDAVLGKLEGVRRALPFFFGRGHADRPARTGDRGRDRAEKLLRNLRRRSTAPPCRWNR
ncbi:MAG: GTPase Era [Anaerotruncus massiliensis (ex Togo et al. 2019)]